MSKKLYNKSTTKQKLERPKQIYPAFSTIRVKDGWALLKVFLDENLEVLSTEVSQPNTKPLITESFKVAVGKYWGTMDKQLVYIRPDDEHEDITD